MKKGGCPQEDDSGVKNEEIFNWKLAVLLCTGLLVASQVWAVEAPPVEASWMAPAREALVSAMSALKTAKGNADLLVLTNAGFGIARRFLRMAMCKMRTSQVYLPPDMRSNHIKPERRGDYYLAMWSYLRDKWSKAGALNVVFARDKPLGQWRYIVQEIYGLKLKM